MDTISVLFHKSLLKCFNMHFNGILGLLTPSTALDLFHQPADRDIQTEK